MRKPYLLVLVIALLCSSLSQTAYAHALWIESSQNAKENGIQTVKVFYGEYEHGTRDLVKDWYADLKELEVWIRHPNGESTRLETSLADNHISASFTPKGDGLYLIHTTHAAGELGGKTKYVFSASLPIVVGESELVVTNPSEIDLQALVVPGQNRLDETVDIRILDKGNASADATVTIISAEGWAKTFKTDAEGKISFQPLWKGMYVVETSKYQPQEGLWNNKPHTHVWQGSTTTFTVN